MKTWMTYRTFYVESIVVTHMTNINVDKMSNIVSYKELIIVMFEMVRAWRYHTLVKANLKLLMEILN